MAKSPVKENIEQTNRSKDRRIEGRGIKTLNRRSERKKKELCLEDNTTHIDMGMPAVPWHCSLSIHHPCFAIGIVAPLSRKEGFFLGVVCGVVVVVAAVR